MVGMQKPRGHATIVRTCMHSCTLQGTDVAIKTFENVSEQSKKDLQREALAMCELRHPYVAQILGEPGRRLAMQRIQARFPRCPTASVQCPAFLCMFACICPQA